MTELQPGVLNQYIRILGERNGSDAFLRDFTEAMEAGELSDELFERLVEFASIVEDNTRISLQ